MRSPEEELLETLKRGGVDLLCTLPCDRVKALIALSDRDFHRIPLAREEEGVGICAGAAMGGLRPAMIVQSSGVGNMMNALLSLTAFYRLPLALFISWRGHYRESIAAQVPMGKALPGLLEAAGVGVTLLEGKIHAGLVEQTLEELYREERIHAFLLSPSLWENSGAKAPSPSALRRVCESASLPPGDKRVEPFLSRFEIIKAIAPALEGNAVVCNLGVPSKELFHVLHQPSNFYMLGSMGMATPTGLGAALSTDRRVFVVDGDGSLLMNPGTLATVALTSPSNLAIIAIDNASYGSTGGQPTHTGVCVDLEAVARGFGIKNTVKAADPKALLDALEKPAAGPLFVHALALPGNAPVSDIPVDHLEIKKHFSDFIRKSL